MWPSSSSFPQLFLCKQNSHPPISVIHPPKSPSDSSEAAPCILPLHVKSITSTSNPFVKHCVKLRNNSSYRHSHGSLLLVGTTLFREMYNFQESVQDKPTMIDCLLLHEKATFPKELAESGIHVVRVNSAVMTKLSGVQSTESIDTISLVRIPSTFHSLDGDHRQDFSRWFPSAFRILVLDGIQDPGNLGSQFHTKTKTMVAQRQIVDQVSGWLTVYDDGFVDRSWTGPPQFKFMSDPVPPHHHFIDGVAVQDVSVNDGDDDLRVRIYLPEKPAAAENLPIILHFHGGGFCISEPDWFMYYNTYTRLAREAGAIVVSPYLRRAPEHRLPAAIDDAYSALLWLRNLATDKTDQFPWSGDADFSRVFLIGDSSGGNIVHEMAKRAAGADLRPLRLAGAIPIHPGFLRSARSRSELENPQTPFLTLDMLDKFLKLGLPEGSTKDHPVTCPMAEAEAVAEFELPPYLVCVADQDLVIDTEMEFVEWMKKGGKEVELFVSNGVGHSFYLNKIAIDVDPKTSQETDKLIKGICHFVEKH